MAKCARQANSLLKTSQLSQHRLIYHNAGWMTNPPKPDRACALSQENEDMFTAKDVMLGKKFMALYPAKAWKIN